MKNTLFIALFLAAALTFGYSNQSAQAQNTISMIPTITVAAGGETPMSMDDSTHPDISLTPDKSTIIKLDEKIISVLIGNPLHLGVVAQSSNILVLVGKEPGSSYFTALGRDGKILMQRHVLVAAPAKNYMRVRKTCALTEDETCEATNVYYCPDGMCHDVKINTATAP